MNVTTYPHSSRKLALLLIVLLNMAFVQVLAQDEFRRPDFSLPDLEGREHSIAEWDGHPLIINFWATWCIPCKREIPVFNAIDAEYEDTDVRLLGIAIDKPDNVNKYLATMPMSYPTLVEEDKAQDVAALFINEPLALPFTIFLDHAGRVFWMQVEEIHREQADVILAYIRRVRDGELSYEQAQMQLVDAVAAARPVTGN